MFCGHKFHSTDSYKICHDLKKYQYLYYNDVLLFKCIKSSFNLDYFQHSGAMRFDMELKYRQVLQLSSTEIYVFFWETVLFSKLCQRQNIWLRVTKFYIIKWFTLLQTKRLLQNFVIAIKHLFMFRIEAFSRRTICLKNNINIKY